MNGSPRILCAVVTYNEPFAATRAAQSLAALPEQWRARLLVCCVENSGSRRVDDLDPGPVASTHTMGLEVIHIATGANGGLALGYNLALRQLAAHPCDQVLFLNSDSHVSLELLEAYASPHANDVFSAQVPRLRSGSLTVSPFRKPGFRFEFYIIGFMLCDARLMGPDFRFPARYWLDGIDLWFSRYLHEAGARVRVVSIDVEHRLSVADGFATLPSWRYRNILVSELAFLRESRAPLWVRVRLPARALARCILHARMKLVPEIWRAWRTSTS
jgi:hypothetical protein